MVWWLGKPQENECKLVIAGDKKPVALVVQQRQEGKPADIKLFRVSDHSLAPTVARHMLRSLLETASRAPTVSSVTDSNLTDGVKTALTELGFVPHQQAGQK